MAQLQPYTGIDLAPGEYSVVESFENEFNGGRWENRDLVKGLVDGASTDTGHTSYTHILRAGILLGQVTSTSKVKPWDPTGTDGTEDIIGVLKKSTRVHLDNTDADRLTGPFIASGMVDPTKIIRSASTSTGIVGDTYEYHIRKQLVARGFKLTDALWEAPYGVVRKRVTKTADYSVTAADRNVRFDNTGDADAINFTLPATASLGLEYWFYVAADQSLTVTAGTADTMIVFNNDAADAVAFSTTAEKVGGMFHVVGNGSKWEVEVMLGQDTQTVTVTDA